MAKHKKHKIDGRDRRDAGGKLPKRIAGVKVPKALRKGGAVRELAGNPVVRDIVAAALTAVAGAVASKKDGKHKGAKGEAGGKSGVGTAALVATFAAAAGEVVKQMRDKKTPSDPEPRGDAPAPDGPAMTH